VMRIRLQPAQNELLIVEIKPKRPYFLHQFCIFLTYHFYGLPPFRK
jgi:hypothetical protein